MHKQRTIHYLNKEGEVAERLVEDHVDSISDMYKTADNRIRYTTLAIYSIGTDKGLLHIASSRVGEALYIAKQLHKFSEYYIVTAS